MSRPGWFMSSSQWFVLMAAITYTGGLAGCRPAETPPESPSAAVDDHDHDGHDHDGHDHDGHDHDGHDHDHSGDIDVEGLAPINAAPPLESLGQGVEQLVVMRDTIAKGFADDDIDSIHDQLHDVGGLLGQIEDMIPETDIPEDTKQQMQQAVDTLFDAYGEVDLKLHGDKGKEYKDVSGEINTAVDTLTKHSLS